MKTDDLIAMLATNVEPVPHGQVERTVGVAILVGAALALTVMLLMFGIRADLETPRAFAYLSLKLTFTLAIVALTSLRLTRLAIPGGEQTTRVALVALPFAAIVVLAGLSLGYAPISFWDHMIMGDKWLECLLSIPIIAIVPFVVIIWAVRQTAPTDLVRTGALAGLAAGGVSATAYALHCTDDFLPFVALWYGGTIALCTFAGAKLGPRLLRW